MPLAPKTIEAFRNEGAAVLRGVISKEWVDRLRHGVDQNMVRLDAIRWQQGERCAVCSFYKAHSNQNLGKPTRPLALKEVSSFASALLLLCV